ncbi:MAG: HD domain-containing protein [Methanosarcina sp.]|nr:metal-dependent phosphohydrolase [Methanosarcina sp. Ant1]
MQKEDLDFFRKWFLDYVDNFSSSDSFIQNNIKMKIEHTGKVCENILLLAKAEKIMGEGCRLAETIALFHDLGRFEQFMRYKTFKDSESENHALLGVKILKRKGILSPISRKERDLILKAVEYHNLMEIPECTENFKELFFYSKLIRDADKLDILRIVSESYKEGEKGRNPALELYLPDTAGCSESIITDILNKRMAKMGDVKNLNDVKLLRLSWIFDINFPATLAILKEHKYLSTIISSMPEAEEVHVIEKHLESCLNAAEIALNERKL